MRESFRVLQEAEIIPQDLAQKLSQMVGFRNVMAHDYEDVNYDTVYDILQQGLEDIESFVDTIEEAI